jgi:hypothetical protein
MGALARVRDLMHDHNTVALCRYDQPSEYPLAWFHVSRQIGHVTILGLSFICSNLRIKHHHRNGRNIHESFSVIDLRSILRFSF